MSLNLTNIYIDNFNKFINNDDVRLDKNYYQKLYKIIYSKRINTTKIHELLLNQIKSIKKNNSKPLSMMNRAKAFFSKAKAEETDSSSSKPVNENNVSNNINERISGGAKIWIQIIIDLIDALNKSKIESSWIDSKSTSFNSFRTKYNTLVDNIQYYKNIILKEMIDGKKITSTSYAEATLQNKSPNKFSIENIYDNIVKKGVIKMNNENKNNHSLYYYYHKMVKSTKNPNTKKHDFSIKIVANGKSNTNATTKDGKFLAKFRKIKFGSDKELHISVLYYNIRKIAQILMLILPTITYYMNRDKYVKNEELRKELLYTILTLRSLISRKNLNNSDNNPQKHKSIRVAFKRVLQNNYLNQSPMKIENLFKNSVANKSNEEVRLYINKLSELIKILVPKKDFNTINKLIKEKINKAKSQSQPQ